MSNNQFVNMEAAFKATSKKARELAAAKCGRAAKLQEIAAIKQQAHSAAVQEAKALRIEADKLSTITEQFCALVAEGEAVKKYGIDISCLTSHVDDLIKIAAEKKSASNDADIRAIDLRQEAAEANLQAVSTAQEAEALAELAEDVYNNMLTIKIISKSITVNHLPL